MVERARRPEHDIVDSRSPGRRSPAPGTRLSSTIRMGIKSRPQYDAGATRRITTSGGPGGQAGSAEEHAFQFARAPTSRKKTSCRGLSEKKSEKCSRTRRRGRGTDREVEVRAHARLDRRRTTGLSLLTVEIRVEHDEQPSMLGQDVIRKRLLKAADEKQMRLSSITGVAAAG